MALYVTIEDNSGGSPISLKADSIEHTGVRPVAQAGLPGSTSIDEEVIVLDLGITTEQITINGTCSSDNADDDYKVTLRSAFMDWFGNITDFSAGTGMPKLTLNSNESYLGSIRAFSFRMEEAKENRWTFSLTFSVHSKV